MLTRTRWAALVPLALISVHCNQAETPPATIVDAGFAPDAAAPYDAGQTPTPDAGVDAGVPPGPTVRITGTVQKLQGYLALQPEIVTGATVTVLGVQGVEPVTSDPTYGTYALEVPADGRIVVRGDKPGYRPTYNDLAVGAAPIRGKSLFLASEIYVSSIADAHQVDVTSPHACHAPNATTEQCGYAMIIGRVVDDGSADDGTPTPMAGIAAGDFTVKGGGDATWYVKGPYFLSWDGQPGAQYTTMQRQQDANTMKYLGGLYVVFVEVPVATGAPVQVELSVASAAGGAATRYFGPVTFQAHVGGTSWITIPESGQPPPPPPPPAGIDFASQIYPLFARVDQGGLGCLGCHTDQGGVTPSGGMNLYGGPAAAYAALNPANYPQRVNLANPAASYLLVRPLYEASGVQDHPIFAFVSDQDPNYQLVYQWIAAGAQLGGQTPPPPVDFVRDVRPILYAQTGAGCYGCHVAGVDRATAPGGLYFGGNADELYDELTAERPTDNGATGEPYRINKTGQTASSLLLLNPLQGSPEPHPAKLFTGTNDPRYQLIYRWIAEGYRGP